MAQRIYAVASDFANLAEEPFDGDDTKLDKRLRSASIEVEGLTRLSVYDVDEEGYPTDADISDAFKEATCAFVEYWEETDDPTGAQSQAGPTRIGSVSFGGSGASGGATNTKSAASSRIAPKAVRILTNAGLITSAVSH